MYLVRETVEGINLFKLQMFIRKIFLLELILQVNTLEKKKTRNIHLNSYLFSIFTFGKKKKELNLRSCDRSTSLILSSSKNFQCSFLSRLYSQN